MMVAPGERSGGRKPSLAKPGRRAGEQVLSANGGKPDGGTIWRPFGLAAGAGENGGAGAKGAIPATGRL